MSKRGGTVQFWLLDRDRQQIRKLHAWIGAQGHRPSASAILSPLRMVKPGAALLEASKDDEVE